MICSISGLEPKEPVISRSGFIFEKKLIEKHIEQHGTCPITGEPMSAEELIPLKQNKRTNPKNATTTSIPSLLQVFQNEWNDAILECFNLRKQLNTTRQELAHALYQHDAACRVIARLLKERDDARTQLENYKLTSKSQNDNNSSNNEESQQMEMETGFTEELKERITKISLELSEGRKTRDTTCLGIDSIRDFKESACELLHSSNKGVLCLDIFDRNTNLILTGGGDNNAVLFDKDSKKKLATLSGHTNAISAVSFYATEDVLFTGSKDNHVNIWKAPENTYNYSVASKIQIHNSAISSINVHPLMKLITSSHDGFWGFHDIETGSTITKAKHPLNSPITSAHIHPDSLLYLTGLQNGKISIWDIRNQSTVATLDEKKAPVHSLKCSENGYYMISSSDSEVYLWDLRKCKAIREYNIENSTSSPITSVDIIHAGKYTAVSGPDVKILLTNSLEEVHYFSNHTNHVTAVKWSKDGTFLASTSADHSLRIFN